VGGLEIGDIRLLWITIGLLVNPYSQIATTAPAAILAYEVGPRFNNKPDSRPNQNPPWVPFLLSD
jgi:hypothetical protein